MDEDGNIERVVAVVAFVDAGLLLPLCCLDDNVGSEKREMIEEGLDNETCENFFL